MNEGQTCYERDEMLCEDQMCLRTGCRILNDRLARPSLPKLCKDCLWAKRTLLERFLGIWIGAKCTNPRIGKDPLTHDPLTGKTEGGDWPHCAVNRMHSSDNCGFDGKLWEPK